MWFFSELRVIHMNSCVSSFIIFFNFPDVFLFTRVIELGGFPQHVDIYIYTHTHSFILLGTYGWHETQKYSWISTNASINLLNLLRCELCHEVNHLLHFVITVLTTLMFYWMSLVTIYDKTSFYILFHDIKWMVSTLTTN